MHPTQTQYCQPAMINAETTSNCSLYRELT